MVNLVMRRFRLSTLFWLIFIAALLAAWRNDHRRFDNQIRELRNQLEAIKYPIIIVN